MAEKLTTQNKKGRGGGERVGERNIQILYLQFNNILLIHLDQV